MLRRNPHLQSPYPNIFRIFAATMHSPRLWLSNHRPKEQKIHEFSGHARHQTNGTIQYNYLIE